MDKYRMIGKKGEGTFSEVLKCQNTKDGTLWACKKMKQHYSSSEELKEIREIQALRHLSNNPHVLQLHEVIFERKTGTLNLIFELMDMNLYELIRSQRTYFTNERVANYMLQLLKAIEHMHKHGYFHRDIKPENILIKDDLLKLADFGSVRRINTKHPYTEYISTRWYRAPECLLTDGYYSYPMDIWSAGCVMFEIITLHPLFPGVNEVDQIDKIHDIIGTPDNTLLEKFRQKSRNIRFNFKPKKGIGIARYMPNFPRDSIDLVNLLCTYDPDMRISAHRALKHRYFNFLRDLANKENDSKTPGEIEGIGGGRVSKKSIDMTESASVLELHPEILQAGAVEMYKPIMKRKKKYSANKALNQFGSTHTLNNQNKISLSALNNHNQPNSTSLSVLSHYSDTNNLNISGHHSNINQIKFATKRNPLHSTQHAVLLPKLSTSTSSLPYATYQSSSSIQNLISKIQHQGALPQLYNSQSPSQNSIIDAKIINKMHSKYA